MTIQRMILCDTKNDSFRVSIQLYNNRKKKKKELFKKMHRKKSDFQKEDLTNKLLYFFLFMLH